MGYCPHCGARGDPGDRHRVYAAWLERRRERLEAVYDDRSPEAGAYRASVLAELAQVLGVSAVVSSEENASVDGFGTLADAK